MQRIGNLLAAIGRHGAIGFALSLFLGIGLPQLAASARPLLPVTIFCFMTIVFLRADLTIIARLLRHPRVLTLSCLWLTIVPVLIVAAIFAVFGRAGLDPGVVLGLAILGAAPPIMSSPAVAILYGFEPALIIASVLGVTILSPLLAPILTDALAGQAVPLDASVLMMRLAFFVAGGFAAAVALRKLLGRPRVLALKRELDGLGVVLYFIFAIAAMDGVGRAILERPVVVASFIAIAFAVSIIGLVLAMIALRFVAPADRFILGYGTGQRNMGLLIAALGAGVPETTFLFFALAQFPIYLMPWLLNPLARRISAAQQLSQVNDPVAP